MFWVLARQMKACSVCVAASGVFFKPETRPEGSEEAQRDLGRPKYMCKTICVIFGGHLEVKYLSPLLPGPSPCRTLLVCPNGYRRLKPNVTKA